jgi:chromate transporter
MQPQIDWLAYVSHLLQLSLLSIGGVITVLPDMHRVLVADMGLVTDAQFSASIALAQASPGPNVLFVAVMGYQAAGLVGALVALAAILLPSGTLVVLAARWGNARRTWLPVRAFKAGVAPIAIGLMFSSGWILAAEKPTVASGMVIGAVVLLVWRTRVHLLLLIAAGALLGALGVL